MSLQEKTSFITLTTYDGEKFIVEEAAMVLCTTIKNMVEDGCALDAIPLPNVNGKTMLKVITYCRKHASAAAENKDGDDEELKQFDQEFIDLNQADLYEVMLAANYLDIKGLLDLACQKVADLIKGKTVEQMRELFNIKNDFTEEEEEKIRRENSWAFE